MKVAYFCYLTQLDTDLSFIEKAQSMCDLTTYIYVNPKHFNKSIIKLSKLYDKSGIFDSSIYPELDVLRPLINLDKVKVINVSGGRFWELKAFSIFMRLSKTLKNDFNIVHITSILQPPEMPLYGLGKKLVLTVHDPLPHSSSNGLKYRFARKLAMSAVNNFVIFNKVQRKDFEKTYHLQNKNILVSKFGTFSWLKLLDKNKTDSLENNNPYILFAGKISRYKGIDYLLQAMVEVHKQYPDVRLIVAGGGTFHFDISEWQQMPYIEFRNRFIPDKELIDLIKGSLFMVCPYTDATQSGVVMSAFTFNKPVIATNVGGLPEMIESGQQGLIVRERDVKALKIGICNLLDNPMLLKTFSSNIERDYSMGEKSWDKIAAQIVEYYNQICNNS